ncbi:hypothetical protein GCM10027444_32700 [Actinopolyspora lacussalsi]
MRYEETTGLSEDQLCWLAERISGLILWDPRNTVGVHGSRGDVGVLSDESDPETIGGVPKYEPVDDFAGSASD